MKWIALIPTLLLPFAYAADIPLVVTIVGSQQAGVTSGPFNQVELKNTGTQRINAWSFAVSSATSSGGFRREFRSADVYMSEVTDGLQGADPLLRILQPGETRVLPVDPLPMDASVQVIAVVLEDNTGIGDDQTLAGFFQKRVAERDEFKTVVDIFDAVLGSQRGAAAIEELKRRFAAGADTAEPAVHRSARMAVDSWSQRLGSVPEDEIDRSLRTYAAFVTKQYEVAAKHAVRK
jgi:hypothetical protein